MMDRMRSRMKTWRPKTFASTGLLLLVFAIAVWQVVAQEATPPDYRTFALRHANAADLAPQVRSVLAGTPGKTDVLIDKKANALLVQGNENAMRLASQLITALDMPIAPTAQAPARGEASVRGYKLPEANADKVVADLRKKFPASTGTSLAVDPRTKQLLAVATNDVHRQIAQQLAAGNDPLAQRDPKLLPANAKPSDDDLPQRPVALKNITWQSFEDFLQRLWGNKANLETNRTGEVASIHLKNAAGEETVANVDRRRNEVSFNGTRSANGSWAKLVSVLDSGPTPREQALQVVPVHRADPEQLNDAIDLIKTAIREGERRDRGDRAAMAMPFGDRAGQRPNGMDVVAKIFQQENQPPVEPPVEPEPREQPAGQPGAEAPQGAIGPVQIEFLQDLDLIIIRGKKEDVERVTKIIREIEEKSAQTAPVIQLYMLKNVESAAVGDLVIQLYNQALAARAGRVSITPLGKPNALLLIGTRESINSVLDLVKKLDVPVNPNSQFKVFQLKYMDATNAKTLLDEFFLDRGVLGTRVRISVDTRTNAVVVYGGERDLLEAESLLKSVDVGDTPNKFELRIFKLANALATDLAPILQQAISGQGGAVGQQPGVQPQPAGNAATARAASLILTTLDAQGNKILESGSGILSDVVITADTNSNSILVRGPANSMDLIGALIRELDRLPDSEAQIKVFTIINGDATALATMLQQLFGQGGGGGGGGFGNQGGFNQPITAGGENSLVPLSFAIDTRTNSIIASGSSGDLNVVEAILLRLDEGDIRQRKTTVYRLKNAPAIDVANAINQFLTSERAVQQLDQQNAANPFQQLEREVVVVPEAVSNSLIVSATPRFYEEIARVVEELDARPPMVMIQVLIAEVSLSDQEEFGAEFGLQDSLLFDRGVATAASVIPGFNFVGQPLGNSGSATSLATRNNLAGQSTTNFSVGRQNGTLGYGGLVLSASSDSVSILIRALQDAQRMQVLSRPQVMTLDNQSAFVQVGQRVPRITSTTNSQNGITNATVLENVGLLLGVTPRISPDGLVVMEIDAEKSQLGPVDTGIPISINANGDVIRSPIINTTLAQTTVSARSGQTVILSGLITKNRAITSRRVPYLSDIPVLGRIFRFDSSIDQRQELLIIMTPHIVRNEADADWIKQIESDRMSWCLADVVEIHGPSGLSEGYGLWGPPQAPIIYPDIDPTGTTYEAPLPLEGETYPGLPTTPSGRERPPLTPPMPQNDPLDPLNPLAPPAQFQPPGAGLRGEAPSSRRAEGNRQPTPARPETKAAYTPLPGNNDGIRRLPADNAQVSYGPPPARPGSYAPPKPIYPPAQRDASAAYYEQPRRDMNSPYPTQPAYLPAR